MRFVEQLVAANAAYYADRTAARRFNPVGCGRSKGVRRDKVEARASRNLRNAKRAARVQWA